MIFFPKFNSTLMLSFYQDDVGDELILCGSLSDTYLPWMTIGGGGSHLGIINVHDGQTVVCCKYMDSRGFFFQIRLTFSGRS